MEMLVWPIETVPRITVAGHFPIADRDYSTIYRGRTHALHLHGYAGRMQLAGSTIDLAPGDLTLSPAGQASGYHLEARGQHWCVHFEPAADKSDYISLPLHIPGANARERMAHVVGLFGAAGDNRIARAAASLALQELLLWLTLRDAPPADSATDRAAALIENRFGEPIGVADIAAAVGRSPAHLARSFRKRFGVTIPHRLLERRAAHARFLLESTDLPIWRVAERVGIPDAQHFNKTLRRLLGASPSAIRAAAGGPIVDPDR